MKRFILILACLALAGSAFPLWTTQYPAGIWNVSTFMKQNDLGTAPINTSALSVNGTEVINSSGVYTGAVTGGAVTASEVNVSSAAGVKITGDGDGAITFLGMGNGSDEDIMFNLDDTSNVCTVSSSTSMATVNFNAIALQESGIAVLNNDEVDSGAELLAIIDDETGTGVPVFSTSPALVTPAIGAATGASLKLSESKITAGTGTGLTVGDVGSLRTQVYKVSLAKEAFVAASVTQTLTIATLPAKSIVHSVFADVTEAFACTAVCTSSTLSAKVGVTGTIDMFLLSFDLDAALDTFGIANGEMGAGLSVAASFNGGYNSWAGVAVLLTGTSGTGNWGDGVTTTNLSAGAVTVYILASVLP